MSEAPNTLKHISTEAAPAAKGHYSQAVVANGFIFVSGQLPFQSNGEPLEEASPATQVKFCLRNLSAILEASGSQLNKVVRVTIYISDIDMWPSVNSEYTRFFGEHKPARTVVPCNKLHYGFDVEVDAIALQE